MVELSLVESYSITVVTCEFVQFSPILKQLAKVGFILDFPWINGCPLVWELLEVKELRLDVRVWNCKSVYLFGHLLESFPNVNAISLRLFWPENHDFSDPGIAEFEDYGPFVNNLRVFEMDDFISNGIELEFFEILVSRAESIEVVVVRVARRASVVSDEYLMDACEREDAMESAREDFTPLLSLCTRIF